MKTTQRRQAKAVYSELAGARESASIVHIWRTRRQGEDRESSRGKGRLQTCLLEAAAGEVEASL